MSLVATSELVDDLQRLGYVERRSDPLDGRAKLIVAGELRVSKQGLGQLVTQLAAGGFLVIEGDAADRRAKRVRRTAEGDQVVRGIRDLLDGIEARWRDEVGPERYEIFRSWSHSSPARSGESPAPGRSGQSTALERT
ncbi:MAG TPA: hypothetical protein VFH03_05480 [Actinoplanes sp.]|nr:hypothetical protein [Actinoplanes sp.]